ncbi:hypothetical protein CORC01_02398 [Colletotrichum orchidophilum]|uniref:Ubiquitin-like modifier HUB1 n=1 Tax=Colletotrichum orchidophilum TaxID=1209926 RepID=A0A1G4BM49_9PEZI|nr:uncharacterized protein CORC01_02398 [Colletotrichum orchidophilum]OHF02405.1 hypothetical protein CORC01_02398 [Colletotrichum orchidophilum]
MADRARSRSRSPRRDRDRDRDRPRKQGGFRWKDKSRRDDRDDRDDRRGLERGYRNRSRSPRRDRDSDRDRRNNRGGDDNYRPRDSGGASRDRDRDNNKPSASSSKDAPTKPKKEKSAPAPAAGGGEEMIIVHVNDRLGTKAAIPCLASDPVKMFKIMVAQRVGREPHEILLKRQGERPFKDNLTLEDYGVSNGVQLDLEVDTGD